LIDIWVLKTWRDAPSRPQDFLNQGNKQSCVGRLNATCSLEID